MFDKSFFSDIVKAYTPCVDTESGLGIQLHSYLNDVIVASDIYRNCRKRPAEEDDIITFLGAGILEFETCWWSLVPVPANTVIPKKDDVIEEFTPSTFWTIKHVKIKIAESLYACFCTRKNP